MQVVLDCIQGIFNTPREQFFVDQIYNAINQISQARFTDGNIVLDSIGEDSAFFLYDYKNFEKIRNPQHVIPGLLMSGITGLILKKNDDNSNGEVAKRDFVEHLERETTHYFNSISMGWELHAEQKDKFTYARPRDGLNFSTPHCNLIGMYQFYVQSRLLKPYGNGLGIQGVGEQVWIQGQKEEIQLFIRLLKKDSIRVYQPLHLLLAAANDNQWVAGTGLLKDVVVKIAVIYFSAFMTQKASKK